MKLVKSILGLFCVALALIPASTFAQIRNGETGTNGVIHIVDTVMSDVMKPLFPNVSPSNTVDDEIAVIGMAAESTADAYKCVSATPSKVFPITIVC